MDSLLSAAARALAAGDALAALQRVSLRDDPPALALRGIAIAQLGDLPRARALLRRATRAFDPREASSRARCQVAEAEVALALRDLSGSTRGLDAAGATLEAHGDAANALQAAVIAARRSLLLGRIADASARLDALAARPMPPAQAAVVALASAELAMRTLRIADAQAVLARADAAAARAGVSSLQAEVAALQAAFDRPAARRLMHGRWTALRLREVAALRDAHVVVVDACRHGLRAGDTWRSLARRPLLFALARQLAEAAAQAARPAGGAEGDGRADSRDAAPADAVPDDGVDRDTLIEAVFRIGHADDTLRARLRVEVGRLRALLAGLATITATPRGYALRPLDGRALVVLAPPVEGDSGALLALLADGAAWSTSALALALDTSQRTVQRALSELEAAGRVRAVGQARARRWLAPPLSGITTILLLPAALPIA